MAKVSVQTDSGVQASIEVVDGIGKVSKKPWSGVSIKVGDWSMLVFPKTSFEMKYIREQLGE